MIGDQVRAPRLGRRWEAMRAYDVALARTPAIADALQTLLALFAMPAIPDEVLGRIGVAAATTSPARPWSTVA